VIVVAVVVNDKISLLLAMADSKQDNKQVEELRKSNPNILFIISRSKNLNIVVYEAALKNNQLDPSAPVSVYWLDIDPAYVKKNRDKGIMSDRSELNMIEKSMAYGLSSEAVAGKPGHYKVTLVAFKERPVFVSFDAAANKLKCEMNINGSLCELQRIFINSTDRMLGLPKVNHVDIYGIDSNGQAVSERVIPK
jgi:hypothetical protein